MQTPVQTPVTLPKQKPVQSPWIGPTQVPAQSPSTSCLPQLKSTSSAQRPRYSGSTSEPSLEVENTWALPPSPPCASPLMAGPPSPPLPPSPASPPLPSPAA